MRRELMTHPCPGCGVTVLQALLACPDDWRRLPDAVRQRIHDAYTTRHRHQRGYVRALSEALGWFREHPRPVAHPAIAAVHAALNRPSR